MIPLWLFLATLVWAVVATIFLLYRNPLPIPDRGHRCFAVPNETAAQVVLRILGEIGGMPERFTFVSRPTRQTVLWDNTTVIIRYSELPVDIPRNAISIVTEIPLLSAENAAKLLREKGFAVNLETGVFPGLEGELIFLTSTAFDGWSLVFRKHMLEMPSPEFVPKTT